MSAAPFSTTSSPRADNTLRRLAVAALIALALVATGCAPSTEAANADTGDPEEPAAAAASAIAIGDVVGTELTATKIVPMTCIPSRTDPVGVWIGVQIIETIVGDDTFSIALSETDARLGSHPSGCNNPELLLAQSVFLLRGDEDAVLASTATSAGAIVTLNFELGGRAPDMLDVMILPTLGFATGDGTPQTTIFGLLGRYPML